MVRRLELLVVFTVFLLLIGIMYINLNIVEKQNHSIKYQRKHFKDVFFHNLNSPDAPETRRDWLEAVDPSPIKFKNKKRRKGSKRHRKRNHREFVRIRHHTNNNKGDLEKNSVIRERLRDRKVNSQRKPTKSHKLLLDTGYENVKANFKAKHPRWFSGLRIRKTRHNFMRKMTKAEIILTMETIRQFQELMKRSNIVYFMSIGTLLGSYRHHGFIPWNENIDFVMSNHSRSEVARILEKVEPEFTNDNSSKNHWKFYNWQAKSFGKQWKWPYIGIGFYKANATHLWDLDPYMPNVHYNRSDVFPLKKRPFIGMTLPSPKKDGQIMQSSFDLSSCSSPAFDYKRGLPIQNATTIDCSALKNKFPFVERNTIGKYINETLVMHGKIVDWFINKE